MNGVSAAEDDANLPPSVAREGKQEGYVIDYRTLFICLFVGASCCWSGSDLPITAALLQLLATQTPWLLELTPGAATFHGFGRLDELGHGARHSLGADRQLLLEVCAGLLQDLQEHECTSSKLHSVRHPCEPAAVNPPAERAPAGRCIRWHTVIQTSALCSSPPHQHLDGRWLAKTHRAG